jgi:putative transposase
MHNPKIFNRKSLRLKGYDYSSSGSYFITICCQDNKHRFGHVENDKMILNEFGQIAHNEWLKLADRFPNFEMDTFQIMPNHMHSIITLREGSTLAVDPHDLNNHNDLGNDIDLENIDGIDEGSTLAVDPHDLNNHNDLGNDIDLENIDGIDEGSTLAVDPHDLNNHNDLGNDIDLENIDGIDERATARVAPTIDARVAPTIDARVAPTIDARVAPTIPDIVGAYKSLVANGCLNIYKSKNEIMGKFWQRSYYERIIRNERAYKNITNYIINNPSK